MHKFLSGYLLLQWMTDIVCWQYTTQGSEGGHSVVTQVCAYQPMELLLKLLIKSLASYGTHNLVSFSTVSVRKWMERWWPSEIYESVCNLHRTEEQLCMLHA